MLVHLTFSLHQNKPVEPVRPCSTMLIQTHCLNKLWFPLRLIPSSQETSSCLTVKRLERFLNHIFKYSTLVWREIKQRRRKDHDSTKSIFIKTLCFETINLLWQLVFYSGFIRDGAQDNRKYFKCKKNQTKTCRYASFLFQRMWGTLWHLVLYK